MTLADTLQQAYEHYGAGRLEQVETLCREILQAEPAHAEALHLLGALALRVGKHDVAAEILQLAVTHGPGNASYHSNLGEAYRQTGRLDEAEAQLRQALSLDSNLASGHANLGATLLLLDRIDEAVAALDEAIRLDPALASPHFNKGNALYKTGDLESAKKCYERSVELEPGNTAALSCLGDLARREGRNEDARHLFGRVVELNPNDAVACHELGCALQLLNDAQAALPLHQRAVDLDPTFAEGYMGLSSALAKTGRGTDANKASSQVIRLNRSFEIPAVGDQPMGRIAVLKGLEDKYFTIMPERGEWLVQGVNNLDSHIDEAMFSQFSFFVDGLEPGRAIEFLPPCDLIVNVISDVDAKPRCHEIAKAIAEAASVPIINHPDLVEQSQRHLNYRNLRDIDGAILPKTIRIDGKPQTKDDAAKLLDAESFRFPLLVRRVGTHAGASLEKTDDLDQLWTYFTDKSDGSFFIIEFVDFSIDGGEFVKMRMHVVDGELYPNQLYIYEDWNIQGWPHVKKRMLENDWMIEHAERFLGDPEDYLGPAAYSGLKAVCDRFSLDFFGVDFGRSKDGRVVVFEANANMQIPFTKTEVIAARIPSIEAITQAVQRLFAKRIDEASVKDR